LGEVSFSRSLKDVSDKPVAFCSGYAYISNQYGLAVDNIVAFELVMPNGTVATITNESDADLFFGLRVSSYTSRSRPISFLPFVRVGSTILYVIVAPLPR
jgi:hypothetical protein